MSDVIFTPELHAEYIVVFRINQGGTFVTYDNAKDHAWIPDTVLEEGKQMYESEMNQPF